MKRIIVSRHPATVEFIRRELPNFADAPVLATATSEDVAGAVVAGNLPLDLAANAHTVYAVCFRGPAPRGQEYGLAEMDAAGAHIRAFRVHTVQFYAQCGCRQVPTESGYVEDCAYHDARVYAHPFAPLCSWQWCTEVQ